MVYGKLPMRQIEQQAGFRNCLRNGIP